MNKGLGVCLLVLAGWPADDTAAAGPVPTYRATYDVFYERRRVGRSEFSVTRGRAAGTYRFESVSRLRGLFRLISPRPLVELSEFSYRAGRIRPLRYAYEDGTRRGEDSYRVDFDWENGVATTAAQARTMRSALAEGMLDRGSMQVAVMLDLRGAAPDAYTLVDADGIGVYDYSMDGEQPLDTPLGVIAAQKYIQQRHNSTRRTVIWVAETLNYLPIRIEQQRDGVTRAAFELQSVEWLEEVE